MKKLLFILQFFIFNNVIAQEVSWPASSSEINTGSNATYLIQSVSLGEQLTFFGYDLGAFYINDSGELECGGIVTWSGIQTNIAVYGDDSTTPEKDGFSEGEQITWLAYGTFLEQTYAASVVLGVGPTGPGSDIYSSNSINIINEFNIDPTVETLIQGCELPSPYTNGSTGNNLTTLLHSSFLEPLDLTSTAPYIVALTPAGQIVGSACIASDCLTGGMQSVAIWGDNTLTPEIDGAQEGELITLKIIDGTQLNIVISSPITYTANGTILISSGSMNYECNGFVEGCSFADPFYDCEGVCLSDFDGDGVCDPLEVLGCTDNAYLEYDSLATENNGSCTTLIYGCTQEWADNFNQFVSIDDGSCELTACPYSNYLEYNSNYTIADASMCETWIEEGCTNTVATNYNQVANVDDGSCIIVGCMNPNADNFNLEATTEDVNSCIIYGCTNSTAENYTEEATIDSGTCIIYGCTLNPFLNYNPEATFDDGTCSMVSADIIGCTNPLACNFNELATVEDGSCIEAEEYYGCDGNCITDTDGDGICDELEVVGCQDLLSMNYNSLATDPGICNISWYEYQQMVSTQIDSMQLVYDSLLEEYNNIYIPNISEVNIPLSMPEGWSMFGYTCLESISVEDGFAGFLDQIILIKDDNGECCMPELGYDGIGDLEFSKGYKIKLSEEITDFQFCPIIIVD